MTDALDDDDLQDLIHEASSRDELWPEALAEITRAFRSHAGALYIQRAPRPSDQGGALHQAIPFLGFGSGMLERYDQHFHALNPFHSDPRRLKLGEVITDAALLDGPAAFDLHNSEFFVDWCQPQGFTHAMGEVLQNNDAPLTLWLNRHRGPGFYTQEEQTRFHRVARSLRRCVQSSEAAYAAHLQLQALHTAIGALCVGVLLIDRQRRILSVSPEAERFLSGGEGLAVRLGRLCVLDQKDGALLDRRLVAASLLPASGQENAQLEIRRPDGRPPLSLTLVPTKGQAGLFRSEPNATFAVLIRDVEADHIARLRDFGVKFRLTPAELRLALVLRDGTGLRPAAQSLGISYETARSQMKALLAKTGARRQAEFVSMVGEFQTVR